MKQKDKQNPTDSQLIIYQTESGKTKVEVRLQDETVWLTQQLMAELFQTSKQSISYHIKSIYEEGELVTKATVKEILTVQNMLLSCLLEKAIPNYKY